MPAFKSDAFKSVAFALPCIKLITALLSWIGYSFINLCLSWLANILFTAVTLCASRTTYTPRDLPYSSKYRCCLPKIAKSLSKNVLSL